MNDNINLSVSNNKTNKAFMILSALGIIFVLDAHVWSKMSFLSQIFPYDSFFMPMFVFISGYFFKEKYVDSLTAVVGFVKNKIKKLLVPFIGWTVIYGVVTTILTEYGILNFKKWDIIPLIKNIIFEGTSFGFNSPSWFVPLLFYVSIIYIIVRKSFNKIWNEPLAMLVMFALGTVSVYFCGIRTFVGTEMLVLKILFFLQFFELGIVFNKYIEKWFDKANSIVVMLLCIFINMILLSIYGAEISFPNCAYMGGFRTGNIFLPVITSITGISFWLKICKALAPVAGTSKLVNFISNNTFFIMTHHLTFKALFNGLLILGKKFGVTSLEAIDAVQFKSSAWYVFTQLDWAWTASFLFMTIGTLTACYLYLKIKGYVKVNIFDKIKTSIQLNKA